MCGECTDLSAWRIRPLSTRPPAPRGTRRAAAADRNSDRAHGRGRAAERRSPAGPGRRHGAGRRGLHRLHDLVAPLGPALGALGQQRGLPHRRHQQLRGSGAGMRAVHAGPQRERCTPVHDGDHQPGGGRGLQPGGPHQLRGRRHLRQLPVRRQRRGRNRILPGSGRPVGPAAAGLDRPTRGRSRLLGPHRVAGPVLWVPGRRHRRLRQLREHHLRGERLHQPGMGHRHDLPQQRLGAGPRQWDGRLLHADQHRRKRQHQEHSYLDPGGRPERYPFGLPSSRRGCHQPQLLRGDLGLRTERPGRGLRGRLHPAQQQQHPGGDHRKPAHHQQWRDPIRPLSLGVHRPHDRNPLPADLRLGGLHRGVDGRPRGEQRGGGHPQRDAAPAQRRGHRQRLPGAAARLDHGLRRDRLQRQRSGHRRRHRHPHRYGAGRRDPAEQRSGRERVDLLDLRADRHLHRVPRPSPPVPATRR